MQTSPEFLKRRAKELDADEGFKAILKVLKERAIRDWANTASGDQYRREELYRDILAVGRIENYIREVVGGEKLDARKAEKAEKGPLKR